MAQAHYAFLCVSEQDTASEGGYNTRGKVPIVLAVEWDEMSP